VPFFSCSFCHGLGEVEDQFLDENSPVHESSPLADMIMLLLSLAMLVFILLVLARIS
jgi:hypothetical protein